MSANTIPWFPVVIVGAGPTGITAATLLAQYGVRSLVLDRWSGVYPQPRAVHLDDEIYRVLARLGIDATEVAPEHWRHVNQRLAAGQEPRAYSREQHDAWLKRRCFGP